ncbi:MAG: hypothetical protein ACOYM3_07565 [Terrimicrobiaceae bacterium]
MRKSLICFCLALLAVSSLRADVELAFAVPDDGRVTLGVFNDAGKLVRVLHKLARQEDFRIGLNGLITSWDGRNDAGGKVPDGHYYVRGYLIGEEVKVSGENFLFNDWAADEGFPGFSRIRDFSMLTNGDLVLLAEAGSAGHQLARFSPEKGFLWATKIEGKESVTGDGGFSKFRKTDAAEPPTGGAGLIFPGHASLPGFSPLLTANSNDAVVVIGEEVAFFTLGDGEKSFSAAGGGTPPLALAADDSQVFVNTSAGLAAIALPGLKESVTTPPSAFTSMDAEASVLIGASPEGVWIRQETFAPVTLPATVKSVALGMPGTFWFVGNEGNSTFVGQAAFSGEILRLLRPAPEDPKPEKIRASRTMEKFAVLESLPGLQRVRVMTRSDGGEWTIEWERSLRDCTAFGFVDGVLKADAGSARQEKEIRFRLNENPLTGKKDFLTVRAEFDATGSRLVSPDDLPLVEISARQDIKRLAIHCGDSTGQLRCLQGNGVFVEEFSITWLDDILPLDAGGIDLP